MTPISLSGLRAEIPLGAMAAFGCLRVCDRTAPLCGSKLAWEARGGVKTAVLWTPHPIGKDGLIELLVQDVKRAQQRAELTWGEQIKSATTEEFGRHSRAAVQDATAKDRETADWFSAFGNELAASDGTIDATPFDMSVARQKFLADALKLAAGLAEGRGGRNAPAVEEAYAEALFGPWKYADDQHSLGWDPSTMKLGAFSHKAPTGMANAGVRAAVWLAFESLPLFPCFWSGGLATVGFQRRGREVALCWPVWRGAVGLAVLKSLLARPELIADRPPEKELRALGVTAVYRSARFKPNKYLASFRTPELAYSAAAG